MRRGAHAFSHALHGTDLALASRGRVSCTDTVTSLDAAVTFASSPEGVTARIGTSQSPFYPLPAGLQLEGCCGDPCCQ